MQKEGISTSNVIKILLDLALIIRVHPVALVTLPESGDRVYIPLRCHLDLTIPNVSVWCRYWIQDVQVPEEQRQLTTGRHTISTSIKESPSARVSTLSLFVSTATSKRASLRTPQHPLPTLA